MHRPFCVLLDARVPLSVAEVAGGGLVVWEGGVLLALIDSSSWRELLGVFSWAWRRAVRGRRGVVGSGLRMRSRLRCNRDAGSSGGVSRGDVTREVCRGRRARRSSTRRSARS
jgi:hypothetical protein